MTRRRYRAAARGVSLVELLAAMTILMVVAGVAAALIESLYHVERAGREHAANEAAVARIAQAFRRDVRAARSATIGTHLTLAMGEPGRSIIYSIRGDEVGRFEWQELAMISQDSFRVPPKSSPRFGRPDGGTPSRIALTLDRRARKGKGESTSRPLRIEATLSADHRFEGTQP